MLEAGQNARKNVPKSRHGGGGLFIEGLTPGGGGPGLNGCQGARHF